MNLLNRFLNKVDFNSYEEMKAESQLIVPKDFNFAYDIVDEYARLVPEKRALVWCNSEGDEKILTFKDISLISNKIANYFLSLGLKKGDYIMTMLNRRWEFWAISVACCKVGIVLIPATHLLTPKDIYYRCNSADVKLLIATKEKDVIEHIADALPKCTTLKKVVYTGEVDGFDYFDKEFDKCSDVLDKSKLEKIDSRKDVMLMYFTSGTTGMPKMVQHNFEYPVAHIYTAYYWHAVVDDGLHFTMAETGWAKCSWGKIYGQWIAGTAIFVYDYNGRFTPTDVLPLISKYGITTFCAPPTIYRFLAKEDLSQYDFSTVQHFSTAGEALNAEVAKQFYDATGKIIYEGFGQTESTVILATFKYMEPKVGSLGKPSPCYDIVLLDDFENELGDNTEGEICIKLRPHQYGLVESYKNEPERTQEARGGKYYHTGDLAKRDSDGIYWYVGRKDDIIKSSGYRIGPFEVESALMEHPSVLECAITGVPDPLRGQIVKATIILAKGYTPSEELKKELQDYVKRVTAPYKYPRVIDFVDEMPKTISGKIRRAEIRKQDSK